MAGSRVAQLIGPFSDALRRGTDVIVVRGIAESESADADGIALLRKLAYDERNAPGRFYFEHYPTESHAKILIRDGDEVCVGSLN